LENAGVRGYRRYRFIKEVRKERNDANQQTGWNIAGRAGLDALAPARLAPDAAEPSIKDFKDCC
jgi:hypothetical protein